MSDTKFILGNNEFLLPSGYIDEEGNVHRRVKLKPMTGRVEQAMDKADVRKNGAKTFTELIKGVIVDIGDLNFLEKSDKLQREIVKDMLIVDRDAILLYNSFVSFDLDEKPLEFEEKCQSCGGENELSLDLTKLDIQEMQDPASREFTFELIDGVYDAEGTCHKKITITMPTGRIQELIFPYFQKGQNAHGITMMLLHMTQKLGEAPIIKDTFIDMTSRDRKRIHKYIPQELNFGVDFEVGFECTFCNEENDTQVPLQKLLGAGGRTETPY